MGIISGKISQDFSLLLVIICCLALSACGSGNKNDNNTTKLKVPYITFNQNDQNEPYITWTPPDNDLKFVLLAATEKDFSDAVRIEVDILHPPLLLNDLEYGSAYYLKFQTSSETVENPDSNVLQIKLPPNTPSSIAIHSEDGSPFLFWESDASAFNIYWSSYPEFKVKDAEGSKKNLTDNKFEIASSNIKDDEVFYFIVTAVDEEVESPVSAAVKASIDFREPAVPSELRSNADNESIILSWENAQHANSYKIYRQDTETFDIDSALVFESSDSHFIDENIEQGIQYYYWVVAVNKFAQSERSSVIQSSLLETPNSPPIADFATEFRINENQLEIAQLSASDPESDSIRFLIIEGNDKNIFQLNSSTGELSFHSPVDFESPLNDENRYNITVQISDGRNIVETQIAIQIEDIDEAPLLSKELPGLVDENTTLIGTLEIADPENKPLKFEISGGDDKNLFTIDENNGTLTFIASPDYEAPEDIDKNNIYDITVSVSDGTHHVDFPLGIQINAINELPVFENLIEEISVSENSTELALFTAIDPEGSPVTFSIAKKSDGELFIIDSNTGALSTKQTLDFESPLDLDGDNSYELVIEANDGETISTQTITIIVSDIDEELLIDIPEKLSVNENETLISELTASDPEEQPVQMQIVEGNESGFFQLDAETRNLSFTKPMDFEDPQDEDLDNVYIITVNISDGTHPIDRTIEVEVLPTNDNTPEITNSEVINIDENSTFVADITATDNDKGLDDTSLSISLLEDFDSEQFNFDPINGKLEFQNLPDYETPQDINQDNSYVLTLRVSDGELFQDKIFTINVNDLGPDKPKLETTARNSAIEIVWNEKSSVSQYDVYLSTDKNINKASFPSLNNRKHLENVQSPLKIDNLRNNKKYYIALVAIDDIDETWSNETSSRTYSLKTPINDTGILLCSNGDTNHLDCKSEGNKSGLGSAGGTSLYAGQDAEYGRDYLAGKGQLMKAGSGMAGFEFIILDDQGKPRVDQSINYTTSPWNCVKDNVTNLVWEVKTDTFPAQLRDAFNLYTWFNPDNKINGGNNGSESGGICFGEDKCNTQEFVNQVNSQKLCGFNDWRLPTLNELKSLVNHNITIPNPTIDTNYFPNTASIDQYWTSDPAANKTEESWSVGFYSGESRQQAKAKPNYIRLVRHD